MANGKNASRKRQEDDCLDGVRLAVRQFDQRVPLGTYKMDQVISRFVSERGIPHYVVQSIRRHLEQAVLEGLNGKRHAIAFPVAKSTAALFLQKLKEIRKIALELRAIDPELLSSALAKVNPFDENGKLDPEGEILDIEGRTEDLLPQIVDQIDLYLAEIYLPTYLRAGASNRTIKFTHYFIAELAQRWKTIFGVEPKSADLADMTELMGACLEDFGYPLSSTQRQSRVWISDRIRKQIFRN
jgi:hypothetical protein